MIIPAFRPRNSVRLSLVANAVTGADLASYSFAGLSLGTPSSDRVIIALAAGASANALQATSMTLGGVAMALFTQPAGASARAFCGVAGLFVPVGATGTLVVNLNAVSARCYVWIYTMTGTGGRATPFNSQVDDTGTSLSVSGLIVPRNGAAIALAGFNDGTNTGTLAFTTGVTKDSEQIDGNFSRGEVGSLSDLVAGSAAHTVTATASSASQGSAMAVHSFAPA